MIRQILTVLLLTILFACKQPNNSIDNKQSNFRRDTVGQFVYNIKDTLSTIYISYHECTGCTDAWLDSGQLFLPDSVMFKIKKIYDSRGDGYIPNGHDLYLTGPDKIAEILFGDSLNYTQHWQDKFIITGNAIDIMQTNNGEVGILFKVESYKKLDD